MSSASKLSELIQARELTASFSFKVWKERVRERKLALPLIYIMREIAKKQVKNAFYALKPQKVEVSTVKTFTKIMNRLFKNKSNQIKQKTFSELLVIKAKEEARRKKQSLKQKQEQIKTQINILNEKHERLKKKEAKLAMREFNLTSELKQLQN